MAHIHNPVVGDPVYGGRGRRPKNISEETSNFINNFPRQALHAWRLELTHPTNENLMSWIAPLPDDMMSLLDLLKHEKTILTAYPGFLQYGTLLLELTLGLPPGSVVLAKPHLMHLISQTMSEMTNWM